ncbi:MAG: BamA/TamA family outer membrane protein [Flammeovirgaceae bacterium]|nr:BamA/TamA family outer membrane protein [Flammeovirgaceae bacterium]
MRFTPSLLFLQVIAISLSAQSVDSTQVDLIDILVGKEKIEKTNQNRSARKIHFTILPTSSSIPGGGTAIITAVNAAFVLGDPTLTNVSNIYIIPYTNFAGKYGLYLRPNIWLNKNQWNLIGDYRIAHIPQYTWGLGGNTSELSRTLVDTDYLRIYQTALRRIGQDVYVGIGYELDYHYNISEREITTSGNLDNYPLETKDPNVSSGFSVDFSFDKRYNALNPPRGGYFYTSWRINTTWMGSDQNYQTLFMDARKYFRLQEIPLRIFALRSYYWTVLSGNSPYLNLPTTANAPVTGLASRGFEFSRYRSNAMLYFEAEQRYQLTSNGLFGLVLFANIASASEFDTQQFKYWQLGGGIGLRTKLNKYSNSNIAVDFGFSSNYWSVWLILGEAF